MFQRYLKEAKLIRGFVRTHNQGLNIANINIAACHRDRCEMGWHMVR